MEDKDNGTNTVIVNEQSQDNRHIANAKAAEIVAFVMKSETALATTAKAWGAAVFASVHKDGVSLDTLIGESKLAAGFATLGSTDAGKKAKQRLNVYFSNARLVNERYGSLSEEQRNAILNGETSIHYLAAQFRDADRKAAAEAKKAEAAGEATADASAAGTSASGDEPESGLTLAGQAEALLVRWNASSEDEQAEAYDAMSALFDAVNAAIEAATASEPETVEVKKAA